MVAVHPPHPADAKPPGFGEVDAAAGSDVLTVESTPSTVEYFYDAALTSMW